MKKIVVFLVMGCLAQSEAGWEQWVRDVEIKKVLGRDGQDEYTIRITPGKTQQYAELRFECVYHQEFPWTNFRGERYQKIHEPVSFVYRRRDAHLVNDLDFCVSFRVPMKREVLEDKYGEKVFNKKYPITVSKIRFSGIVDSKALWTVDLPSEGKYKIEELLAAETARKEKEKQKKEDTSDLRNPPPVVPKSQK